MFGQPPRSDSEFWKLVGQNGIDDEEDLPTPVAELDKETLDNKKDDTINSADVIDSDVVKIVEKLSDDVVSSSKVYLATANKKMKQYKDSINSLADKFNLNDCVGVPILTVDRTNTESVFVAITDAKYYSGQN
ncbi:unnamed protein product [Didymodactylos carnosus]|uniref:Uncharacterized protein n=1 Tax=Didymodactylos carnosus TaxID=1234261 RepID=A0A8S2U9I8_9BILA|nr:unnamed protein product [Didymodactylos carnosus]CAF4331582.1 unnamed protein product [Didymodactylos carnosus]